MDDSDNFDVDPALAAAMGFSGFGTQPNKKRKYNTNEGFVDPNIGKSTAVSGANNIPVRENKNLKKTDQPPSSSLHDASASNVASEKPSLEALRHGVTNERGDVAYFLPSFIEDPWTGLKAQ